MPKLPASATASPKILVVEDDSDIAALEKDYLEMAGYTVKLLSDGAAVIPAVKTGAYALVLLDIMLPHANGFELCREIRRFSDLPIILVSSRGESVDIIRGLGLGSNDYITKPFDPAVLVARVKASLANYGRRSDHVLKIGDLVINPQSFQVHKNRAEVVLAPKEFELLCFLAQNPNHVFSKEDLFEHIWGLDSLADTATVAVHINRLREKIEDDPNHPQYLRTVWGAGYLLRPPA